MPRTKLPKCVCGKTPKLVTYKPHGFFTEHYVMCPACRLATKSYSDKELAIGAWNKKTYCLIGSKNNG